MGAQPSAHLPSHPPSSDTLPMVATAAQDIPEPLRGDRACVPISVQDPGSPKFAVTPCRSEAVAVTWVSPSIPRDPSPVAVTWVSPSVLGDPSPVAVRCVSPSVPGDPSPVAVTWVSGTLRAQRALGGRPKVHGCAVWLALSACARAGLSSASGLPRHPFTSATSRARCRWSSLAERTQPPITSSSCRSRGAPSPRGQASGDAVGSATTALSPGGSAGAGELAVRAGRCPQQGLWGAGGLAARRSLHPAGALRGRRLAVRHQRDVVPFLTSSSARLSPPVPPDRPANSSTCALVPPAHLQLPPAQLQGG
nr:uncharacterized protein LOC116831615 [Chelonoidis abingdonii]